MTKIAYWNIGGCECWGGSVSGAMREGNDIF